LSHANVSQRRDPFLDEGIERAVHADEGLSIEVRLPVGDLSLCHLDSLPGGLERGRVVWREVLLVAGDAQLALVSFEGVGQLLQPEHAEHSVPLGLFECRPEVGDHRTAPAIETRIVTSRLDLRLGQGPESVLSDSSLHLSQRNRVGRVVVGLKGPWGGHAGVEAWRPRCAVSHPL
jgi:hypothetical protein